MLAIMFEDDKNEWYFYGFIITKNDKKIYDYYSK